MVPCLCMGIVVNVDVMALYGSADVFSHVFLAVDEKAASDGNDPGIHSYCVTGSGKGPELVRRPQPSEQIRQGQ